jgi:hypothetical protein
LQLSQSYPIPCRLVIVESMPKTGAAGQLPRRLLLK